MGVQATDFITALGKRRDSEKRANATSAKINCYTHLITNIGIGSL